MLPVPVPHTLPVQPVARAGHAVATLRVGRKLIESIIHPTVVRDAAALRTFAIRPVGIEEAIRGALAREEREFAETRWSDALSSSGEPRSWGGVRFGTRLVDSRTVSVDVPAADAFAPIQAIGGATGWYRWNWLWRLRGFLDLLAGGAGMRRGRPHPTLLHVGDTVDFWRVEVVEPNRRPAARRGNEAARTSLA